MERVEILQVFSTCNLLKLHIYVLHIEIFIHSQKYIFFDRVLMLHHPGM